MSAGKEDSGKRNEQMLDDIVRDAEEYYASLRAKQVTGTRIDAIVASLVAWFASFAAIGLSAFALYGQMIYYVLIAFVIAVIIGVATGVAVYAARRRRMSRFEGFGSILKKMKESGATSEDGLHLMDAMHQATLYARKRRMSTALEYGVLSFALVALVGLNAAAGALAGVIVYLYFRYEALRDYEKEEARYADSKKELLRIL